MNTLVNTLLISIIQDNVTATQCVPLIKLKTFELINAAAKCWLEISPNCWYFQLAWFVWFKWIFRDAASGHTAGHLTTQLSQPPLTVSDHGCQRGCRTHWFNASLQYKAWGRGGQQNCLRGSTVVTLLLNLHNVLRASRSQANARTCTLNNAKCTNTAARRYIGNSTGSCLAYVAFSGLPVFTLNF